MDIVNKKKNRIKIAGILATILLIAGGVGLWYFYRTPKQMNTLVSNQELNSIETKKINEPVFSPRRILIPKIKVDTAVVEVGKTNTGNMDVPKNLVDVGWYKYGPKPGETGNSVLAGHVNGSGGRKAIFSYLNTLEVGDDVFVEDENGKKLHFRVTDSKVYPANDAPVYEIFGPIEKTRLNLITCSFNEGTGRNSDRRVVFTERVFDEVASSQ